jgi:hypothetical protein
MTIKNKIINFLIKRPFVYNAVLENADLSALTKKPEKKVAIKNAVGLSMIIFSYIICWPLIILLGVISISLGQPLFVVVGAPVAYGISHLIFLAGMYLAGIHYTKVFLKWATRMLVEKLAGKDKIQSLLKSKN